VRSRTTKKSHTFATDFHGRPSEQLTSNIPHRIRPKDLKVGSHSSFLLDVQHYRDTVVWRTCRQIRWLCPWSRHLTGLRLVTSGSLTRRPKKITPLPPGRDILTNKWSRTKYWIQTC